MKKQFIILLILIFSLGLFTTKFFIPYVHAVYPDPILNESFYPRITSVSSTVVRPANIVRNRDTVEILGENFNNGKKEVNDQWFFPIGNSYGYVDIISWTDSKIVVTFVPGYDKGENAKFRIYFVDKYGDTVYAESPSFTIKEFCHTAYDDWTCPDYGACQSDGTQTRVCVRSDDCQELNNPKPKEMQSCYYAPLCTDDNWSCTDWSICNLLYHTQTRNCTRNPDCQGGVSRLTTQSCAYIPSCYNSDWSCSLWSTCSSSGTQTRSCNKTSNCEGGYSSPATSQSCTYTPACSVDTWQCGNWGTCSPQGIQTRSCNKTYDCPSAETAAPATSQYCQSSNSPIYQSPADTQNIINQELIIRATVKLKCPVNSTSRKEASGTLIDSKGTILTNKHVIADTAGCVVGFINSYEDDPYFGDKQIADIYKVSTNEDIALLKLRNPNNKSLSSIDISQGNNNSLKPTDKLVIYGYPGIGGDTITVTPGYYNGKSGNFLKTDAKIAHGNSGGGAYTTSGIFMGIPTGAIPDDITSLGYILSINTINSWINNSPIAYSPPNTNNYSRVASILENMTVDQIDQLQPYVPGTEPTDSSQKNKNEVPIGAIDVKLVNRLKGYILLQVESRGEAWYVNPVDGKKYYMKDGATAYKMMRNFGLGISNANLSKMPRENEKNNYPSFVNKQKGKILLQVEDHGEAWYVNPKTGFRHYMKDGDAAYSLMRYYSLGISNKDLEKIPEGNL